MTAICKKEVRGFFTSMTGYVFIAFLLIVSGIYFTAYHLQGGYPVFAYTLQSVIFVFLIGVPILTMRVLAEERHQKTDQLLLTAPVTITEIVIGKYLALVIVFLIPVLLLLCYPLILSQFGTIYYPETYVAVFGFFLLGCSFLAIGLYLSSVTESQVIAAVLTFLVLFVCYVIQGIETFFPETADGSYYMLAVLAAAGALWVYRMVGKKWIALVMALLAEGTLLVLYFVNSSIYEGLIQKLLDVLDLTGHFTNFSSGMLNLSDVIYYLSVIGVFLFLTVQGIQKRRVSVGEKSAFQYGSYSLIMTVIVAAAAVILNLLTAEIPSQYVELDLSSNQLSAISDQTKELLQGLDEDVTIYYIVQDSNKDTYVERLLNRYDDLSAHVTVVEKDPVLSPKFVSQYTSESLSENSVIVTRGDRQSIVAYEDMYETEFHYSYYTYETTGFDAEGQITSAIAAVCSDERTKLYVMTGHGEMELGTTFTAAVEKANIEIRELNLITADQVPEDADALLLLSPQSDLSKEETEKLLEYLEHGGRAMLLTDYTEEDGANLISVLDAYGVELMDGVVLEGDSNYYIQVPYYLVPDISNTEVSSDLTGGAAYVLLAAAQGLAEKEEIREGITVTGVLSTSEQAYAKLDIANMTTYEKEEGDIDGPFQLGGSDLRIGGNRRDRGSGDETGCFFILCSCR